MHPGSGVGCRTEDVSAAAAPEQALRELKQPGQRSCGKAGAGSGEEDGDPEADGGTPGQGIPTYPCLQAATYAGGYLTRPLPFIARGAAARQDGWACRPLRHAARGSQRRCAAQRSERMAGGPIPSHRAAYFGCSA